MAPVPALRGAPRWQSSEPGSNFEFGRSRWSRSSPFTLKTMARVFGIDLGVRRPAGVSNSGAKEERVRGLGRDARDARNRDVTTFFAVEEGEIDEDRLSRLVEARRFLPASIWSRKRALLRCLSVAPSVARMTAALGSGGNQSSGTVRRTWTSTERLVIPGRVEALIRCVSEDISAPSMEPLPSTTMP